VSFYVLEDDDTTQDFRGFSVSHEKQIMNDLLKYNKGLTCEEAKLSDEDTVEKYMNANNNAPDVIQLTDSEIFGTILHNDRDSNAAAAADDDDKLLNKEEKISVDKHISLTEKLIHRQEKKVL
jgi:hypothetical protein